MLLEVDPLNSPPPLLPLEDVPNNPVLPELGAPKPLEVVPPLNKPPEAGAGEGLPNKLVPPPPKEEVVVDDDVDAGAAVVAPNPVAGAVDGAPKVVDAPNDDDDGAGAAEKLNPGDGAAFPGIVRT